MKFITILLFATSLQVSAKTDAQGVTLSFKNASLPKVFKEITRQTGYDFWYEKKLLNNSDKITISIQNGSLKEALNKCLQSQNIRWSIVDKIIVLKEATSVVVEMPAVKVEISIPITGRITNEQGEPLAGATVAEKGTNNSVVTQEDGSFTINTSKTNAILVVSYVGYASKEIAVNNQSSISITLAQATSSMSDIVVVGYGTQRKDRVTGAVGEIKSAEIMQSPSVNVTHSLVGRVPGLITVQRTGEPGSDVTDIYIRGIGTNGIAAPLFVIDGIPRAAADFAQINPNEIESVNILKDAASAAVFGVRGGNGVILVTTKRGKSGKTALSYSFNYGIQRATRLPNYISSYEYAVLRNEGLQNVGRPLHYSPDEIEAFRNGNDPDRFPNTDWVNLSLRKSAPQTQHNLSLNGGTESVKYFINLGYANQQMLYKADQFKFDRYNIRSNIDVAATKTTHISIDLSGRVQNGNVPTTSANNLSGRMNELFYKIFTLLPTNVGRYSNGSYARTNAGGNPLVALDPNSGYLRQNNEQFLGRLTISQDVPFVPGLSIMGVAAFDRGMGFEKNWATNGVKVYGLSAQGDYIDLVPRPEPTLSENSTRDQRLTLEAHVNYKKSVARHTFSGLLLYSQQDYKDNYTFGYREGYISAALDQLSVGGTQNQRSGGAANESAIQGVVGRVNYDFAGKYLAEASFRYDGSANFPKDNRWGFFPSLSLGWIATEESFLKNSSFIDFLKVRTSVGLLGNDRLPVGSFFYISRYQFGTGYPFGNQLGPEIFQGMLPNQNITWEKIRKTNAGIDVRFLKNALSLSVDYFFDRRTDILGSRQISVPLTFGAQLPVENIATIDNRGIEAALGYQQQLSRDVRYFLRGNITYARNKQVFIDEPDYLPGSADERNRQTGRALNQQFGYEAIGLFQTQDEIDKAPKQFGFNTLAPGDIRYKDVNGDGKINAEDRVQIGRSNIPEIIYGLSGGVQIKTLEINFLIQGADNVDFNYSTYLINGNDKFLKQNLDRWTSSNPNASFPRITPLGTGPYQNNSQLSSWWVRSAPYVRLKNVEIAYNLPQSITSRIKLQGLRVYANGNNLLTFNEYKFIDPESTTGNGLTYPQQQLFNIGFNVQF